MLPYPHDRFDSHVLLTDGSGNLFVPDFSRYHDRGSECGNAMKYVGVCIILSKRYQELTTKETSDASIP